MNPETANDPLTPERAFVVQLRAGANSANGELSGRIEHVISGRAARFSSLVELAAFMNATIRGDEDHEAQ